jgi:hypothetical protein
MHQHGTRYVNRKTSPVLDQWVWLTDEVKICLAVLTCPRCDARIGRAMRMIKKVMVPSQAKTVLMRPRIRLGMIMTRAQLADGTW